MTSIVTLTTDLLPEHFVIADSTNSHFSQPTNCFDFVDRGSDRLLVTIGDSWTYGLHLANRMQTVFGYLVADSLKCDWLNLGQPGSSNFFIAEKTEELAKIAPQLHYQEIMVLCTFTEVGRGFNSHHDSYLDYLGWIDQHVTCSKDFDRFLLMLNQHCVDRILKAARDKFQVYFASNFVCHLGLPAAQTVDPIWIQLLLQNKFETCWFAGSTGIDRLRAIDQFVLAKNESLFKQWMSDAIDLTRSVDKNINRLRSHGHPDAQDHAIWAAHLSKWLMDKQRRDSVNFTNL